MSESEYTKSTGLTPHRLETLVDGIFAIAMTLLVLSINLPEGGKIPGVGLFLMSQGERFFNFALSFFLLAIFWIRHSGQFHHIKKINALVIWINIAFLLFVTLIPFSTSLMNEYTTSRSADLFFNLNLLGLSALLYCNWAYCLRKNFIEGGGSDRRIEETTWVTRNLIVVPVAAVILSVILPNWSTTLYLTIPFVLLIKARVKK